VKFIRFLIIGISLATACWGSDFADRLYKEGLRAERGGDTLHAYLLYARAAAIDPKNVTYAAKKAALQALAQFDSQARLDPDPAAEADAGSLAGGDSAGESADGPRGPTPTELLELRESLPPPMLSGSSEKKSFDLKGDARSVFETVAAAYGLFVVFDADYQPPPPFTFRMTDAGYPEALRALETVANSFLVALNSRVALVSRDTPQKRTEKEPDMAIEFPVPERMSAQDAQEIVTAVQQTLDIRRITSDPTRHMVYARDQVSKLNAARRMFANLSRLRAQVEVEVELLEVDKNSSLHYGLSLPTSYPLVNFGNFLHNASNNGSAIGSFTSFLSFGGGSTFIGIGIAEATAFATVSRSSATNLLQAQIVSVDGQPATLHVGERYPVVTNAYVGTVAPGSGTVYTPPPTVNFQDLGLSVKMTPTVHDEDDVTLDLDMQFSLLGANSGISGIPIISNRQFTGKVRLKEGEWAVIAGLVQTNDSDVQNGIAGLASIPILGRLFFSQTTREKDSSEVLIVLKPHLLTLPPSDFVPDTIWVGTETRPLTAF
jgi:hypothetical protein